MVELMKCQKCGCIVEVIKDGEEGVCKKEGWIHLTPNTEDAALEKHVPDVTVEGNTVTVKVGSVTHPMLPAHHITNIWLETEAGVQRADLDPEGAPEAVFTLSDGDKPVAAYEYCNLHGFWMKAL